MTPITVCHFATLTRWGGVERMLIDLLQQADGRQVRHVLVSTSLHEDLRRAVKEIGTPWFQPQKRMRYDPRAFGQIAGWMQANHVQLVHSYNAYANAWAYLSTRSASAPILVTGEHGTVWSARGVMRRLDRRAQRKAALTIANSRASARLLELSHGLDPQRIRVLHNGVPPIAPVSRTEARAVLGLPEDKTIIGSIGRLDTPKDFATFIETAARVRDRRDDVLFVLVGGGPQEAELRALVAEHKLEGTVMLTGWREDARTLLQGFDLFVSTSIRESLGNVLVEAAMCGKPVIAPAVDGIPEVVQSNRTGILLTPSQPVKAALSQDATPLPRFVLRDDKMQPPRALEPQQLADEILRLLADEERMAEFGVNGREWSLQAFSFERYRLELEQIYLDTIHSIGKGSH